MMTFLFFDSNPPPRLPPGRISQRRRSLNKGNSSDKHSDGSLQGSTGMHYRMVMQHVQSSIAILWFTFCSLTVSLVIFSVIFLVILTVFNDLIGC